MSSGSERKCSNNSFLVGYRVGQMGQKNGSARGNKEEEGSIAITPKRALPDEALRTRLQFWRVLLDPGLDSGAPRGPWPEFEGPRVPVVADMFRKSVR